MTSIYIPGIGSVPIAASRVNRAVAHYDERLSFSQNHTTGQWCVFMKAPHNEAPIAISGWDNIPHPDDVLKKLYERDSLRHGEKLLDDIHKHNESIRQVYRDKAADASGQIAERTAHILHVDGKTPYHQSFRKIPRR